MTIYGERTGKTIYTLTPGGVPAHKHIAIVDAWGDGFTSTDNNHRHRIKNGEVEDASGHGHRRLRPEELEEAVAPDAVA